MKDLSFIRERQHGLNVERSPFNSDEHDGLVGMTFEELQQTDGGAIVLLALCVLAVCTACTVNVNTGSGDINNSTEASADSTNVSVGHGSGNF